MTPLKIAGVVKVHAITPIGFWPEGAGMIESP
jgi:hypothetical protein